MTISGQVSTAQDFVRRYLVHEFSVHEFERTIFLPMIIEADQAEAQMKNGILTIEIRKKVQEKPKTSHISIKTID